TTAIYTLSYTTLFRSHPGTCACAQFPRLRFRTPLAIVQHVRERYKPTNTGRMLARMVEDTPILPWGMRDGAFDATPLQDPSIERSEEHTSELQSRRDL